MYRCAKGYQRQFGEFEMLKPEWDPDHRNAEDQPADQVRNAQLDPAHQYPDHIPDGAHHAEASRRDVAPERPKDKPRYLQTLHAKWYPYDRNAKQQAEDRPYQRQNNAA